LTDPEPGALAGRESARRPGAARRCCRSRRALVPPAVRTAPLSSPLCYQGCPNAGRAPSPNYGVFNRRGELGARDAGPAGEVSSRACAHV